MVDHEQEKIQQAIESISPAPDARERMLANIRKKAAASTESVSTAVPEKSVSEAPVRAVSRRPVYVKILSIAASVAVLIGCGFLIRNLQSKKSAPTETSIRTEGGQVLFETTYSSSDDLEKATGIRLLPPKSGTDILYFSTESSGTIAGVRFSIGADMYYLYATKDPSDAFREITPDAPSRDLDTETKAQLTTDSDTQTETIVWTQGDVTYCLFNSDTATEDDLTQIYWEIKK
ncbi:MAG: hypothetical protein J5379_04175 [Clostridiales bacterium]|nr:hypothetical protein [Clostridiales bacterium]